MIPWLSGGRVDGVDANLKFNEDAGTDVVVVVRIIPLLLRCQILHAMEFVQ